MRNKGFTLVELIAVIVILSILLLIAVPTYQNVRSSINESIYNTKIQKVLSSASAYAEETGFFVFDIKTLIEEGKLESDNELGEYNDPRNHRNMICDIVNVTFENSQFYGEVSESDHCYTKEELENLYGIADLLIYQDNQEIKEVDGWVRGNIIEVGYQFKEKYKDYAAYVEELSWSGEENKSCGKEDIAQCDRYSIQTGEIKSLTVVLNFNIKKDGIQFETQIKKLIQIDNQAPYVIKDSIVQNNEVNTKGNYKVEFALSDGDGSGIASYAIITGENCNTEEYEQKKKTTNDTNITEYLENGVYHICTTDKVGNRTAVINEDNTFTVSNVDVTKPIIKKFEAKSLIASYNDLEVRLSMEVTDDRPISELKMCISNVGYLINCSWEPYVEGKDWTLNGSLNGEKRIIYLSVQDASGNVAERTAEYIPYLNCSATEKKDLSTWSACSVTCGGGTQTKNYELIDKYTKNSCGTGADRQSCNTRDCCSSKQISGYGNWKACSKTCGGGIQYRDVYYVSSYNGQSCGTVANGSSQSCNTKSCIEYRYRDIINTTSIQTTTVPISEKEVGCLLPSIAFKYSGSTVSKCCIGYISFDPKTFKQKCSGSTPNPATARCPVCSNGTLVYLGSTQQIALETIANKGYVNPQYHNFQSVSYTGTTFVGGDDYKFSTLCGSPRGYYTCETSTIGCPSNYTLYNNKCYGPWSGWSSTPVAASATREVETRIP